MGDRFPKPSYTLLCRLLGMLSIAADLFGMVCFYVLYSVYQQL